MINVLLPAMGASIFFKDAFFPKPLIEIHGKTMLEMVVDNYKSLEPKNYIFVFHEDSCKKYHIDLSVKILAPTCRVIKLRNETAGALCTCLMAVDYIDGDAPLIIANSDQIIDIDYQDVVGRFQDAGSDGGVIVFSDIHPRWSYARVSGDEVVEVAEKRPLSDMAIAGFYYYKHGRDFVTAAKQALLKRDNLEGRYYISATFNQLILMGKRIGYYKIPKERYKSFYSPEKIKEYEGGIK